MDESNEISTAGSEVRYRFGTFTLDVSAGLLSRGGLRIKLQDQPFQLLVLLLQRCGEVVSREEIRQRLWESTTFVDFDKSLGVAVLKVREALGDSAANPRFLETVPRRGYRFIAPVSTEQRPHANAYLAAEPPIRIVPDASGLRSVEHASTPTSATRSRRHLSLITAAGGCALIVLTAIFIYLRRPQPKTEVAPPASTSAPKVRRSVVVLGFRNLTAGPDQNWLSAAFTEMLDTELASNGDLRLVSGEDVANVKRDLSLSVGDTLAKATLGRLRSSLGADVVVVGSYTLLNGDGKSKIRLDIRAQNTALGETVFEDAITGNESDLFDLASQAGSRLRESLNPSLSLAPATDAPRFSGSSNQLAVQFYSEGRARLYDFDFVGARDLLKRAVTADPNFAVAHSALSSALGSLGYEVQARDEAKRALQNSHDLPSEIALEIQGRYQEAVNDWSSAVVAYQKLVHLYPDDLGYGLQLARAQLHASPADSAQTLATLRKLPTPLGDDPRIDLMEATSLVGQNLPKARSVAQTAIAKASAQRATLMVARGYGILCQLDSAAGVPVDQSVSECNLARNSYLGAGDQNNAARTLNDLAGIYYQRGDLAKAQSMWEEAIAVFRKVGDTQGQAASANNVGDVLLTRGKLSDAQKRLEEALAGYKLIGDRDGVALALVDLGQIALLKADLASARSDYDQAVTVATQAADKNAMAYGLAGLGDVLTAEDQLTDARKQHELALKLRREIGEQQAILQSEIALARISLEEGRADRAESQARDCLKQLDKEQLPDDQISAGLVRVDALLKMSRSADAKNELDRLSPLAEKTLNRELQFTLSLANGKILLAEHDLNSSRIHLTQIANDASAAGYMGIAWEAQATLATLHMQDGGNAGAVRQLEAIEAKEHSAGLLLLARKSRTDTRP